MAGHAAPELRVLIGKDGRRKCLERHDDIHLRGVVKAKRDKR